LRARGGLLKCGCSVGDRGKHAKYAYQDDEH
jgi:hypothetical protein